VSVVEQRVDGGRDVARELLGVVRLDLLGAPDLGHDEQPGLAVRHDLRDAADRRRDHRRLARHRLEVDDAERLVDRRADEDRRVRVEVRSPGRAAASPGST
jgi:hypothetical protein